MTSKNLTDFNEFIAPVSDNFCHFRVSVFDRPGITVHYARVSLYPCHSNKAPPTSMYLGNLRLIQAPSGNIDVRPVELSANHRGNYPY